MAQEHMAASSKEKPTNQVRIEKTSVSAVICHLSDHHLTAG